jgi:hypothetical protein
LEWPLITFKEKVYIEEWAARRNKHHSRRISNYKYWLRSHTVLGNTIKAIAGEKAGIIKPNIPIVIGEFTKRN